MTTSKRVASKAGSLLKTNTSAKVKAVAGSDLAQAKKSNTKQPSSKPKK